MINNHTSFKTIESNIVQCVHVCGGRITHLGTHIESLSVYQKERPSALVLGELTGSYVYRQVGRRTTVQVDEKCSQSRF